MTGRPSNPAGPVDGDALFNAADKWVDAKRALVGDGANPDKKAQKRDADKQLVDVVVTVRHQRRTGSKP